MALISKIREKTALVVGVVAVGLILFILGGDLLMGNASFLNGRDDTVGEIAGEDIKYEEYQQAIEEVRYNFMVNTGRNPTEREMNSIRQQAWDKLIAQTAFSKEFDKLGIKVTESELVDMVQGNNITPEIQQAFTNPETGEFNRDQVVSYLQNLPQLPQQQQVAWQLFESNLNDGRLRLKYDNLVILSDYVTDLEAKKMYERENTVAEVKYLYVPFYAISDTAVSVTDDQLREYINNHKEEFQVEEGRTLRYVTFPFTPSAQDSAFFREELDQLKENFAKATNDSAFASINTDGTGTAYRTYTRGELPSQLADSVASLSEGQIYGPFLENGAYKMFKVSEIREDTVYHTRARHILFRTEEGNDAEVRKQAQDVLNQIKKGADFAEMAQQHGQDGTASQGGDLGWFSEGRMVEPFEKAVFARNTPGLVNQLVKTEYGYHIIEVTEPKTNKVYEIASIESILYPSDETRDQAFRKADYFAGVVDDANDFEEAAQTDSLNVGTAENINSNAQIIQGLEGDARQVVRWAYNDASVGSVSPVFELEDAYVVATLTDKTEKGTAKLEDVRDEVTAKVKAELKGKQIIEKLKGLSGSLDEIAEAYGQDANVYSTSDLKLSSNTLPNVGFAPEAIGKAFALKAGEVSEPIAGENGVIMVQTEAITQAPEIADYSSYKEQLRQQQRQQSSFNIAEAIEDFSEIEDQRYKFY